MRFEVPLFVFLSVAAFHSVLSASLESGEKEEKTSEQDGLAELKKIDQMEFEAAQKEKATQMNVTEEQNEDSRYEAAQDGSVEEHVEAESDKTAGAGESPDTAAQEESESESSEERDGRQRRDHDEVLTEVVSSLDEASQDSPKQQDVLE